MKQTWANRVKEHVHFNWDVLEIITKGGGGNLYLADDGTYKPVSGGGSKERRSDWVAPYSYCGTAPTGSAESSNVWTIKRIEVLNDGNVVVLSAINVAWTNRYTVPYT